MLSFNVRKNITFFDYISSYPRYIMHRFGVFCHYLRTYRNFCHVINRILAKEFPIKDTLRNGKHLTLYNGFQAETILLGVENYYEIQNELLVIKKKDLPVVKLYDWENNGAVASIFFDDEYGTLPIRDKEVIDIGANIGDTAIYFALHGAKKVIALEPFPKNYESAKKNIHLNGLSSKIDLIMAGCGNKKGYTKVSSRESGIYSSLATDVNNDVEVPLMTLEDILKRSNTDAHLLKIDCEGCEYDTILSSTSETLKKFSHIFIEYHFGYKNLKSKLEKCGFKVSITSPLSSRNQWGKSRFYMENLYAEKNHNTTVKSL